MSRTSLDILNKIAQIIYDKKGFNILAIDVKGLSSLTDYIIVADANVDRHTSAIARGIMRELLDLGEKPLRVEGLETGDWVVLDYGDIMIHIFSPGLREKYSIERLWKMSKLVDLTIDVSNPQMEY